MKESLFPVALTWALAVLILANTSGFGQSETTNENEQPLSAEDLEHIVRNNVIHFLRLMEDLADEQIDPMAEEMSVFFHELALLAHAMKSIGPDEPERRKKLRKLNNAIAALRSKTRTKVKGILERKQFRKYNLLIDEIAPLPSLIPDRPFNNQPAWEQSDYHLEYPRQQNLKNR